METKKRGEDCCLIQGCERGGRLRRGLCKFHYGRFWRLHKGLPTDRERDELEAELVSQGLLLPGYSTATDGPDEFKAVLQKMRDKADHSQKEASDKGALRKVVTEMVEEILRQQGQQNHH